MMEWRDVRLSDVTKLITDGKHGDCVDEPQSGYFFISSKDVYGGRVHYENARNITQKDFEETHKRTQYAPKDILITNSGTIGRLAIAAKAPEAFRTTFQKSVAIVKPNNDKAYFRYLYYNFLCYNTFLSELAGGTAQKNLLLSNLRKYRLRLPPLPIQRKIAAVLSAYDDLIENNNRRIAILEKMAEELYREWFVRLRFPGHEKVKIGKGVPEGWDLIPFSKLVHKNPTAK